MVSLDRVDVIDYILKGTFFLHVGKTTLVNNLAKRLGARVFHSPPKEILEYRHIMVKQCQPVCRAFYSLGNYLIAENIKDSLITSPVVLDRCVMTEK